MGAGASGIGRECRFACAACHTLFNRPINSGSINRCSGYIGKIAVLFSGIEPCCSPNVKHGHTASARGISIENSAISGNDIIFFRPQRGLIKIVACNGVQREHNKKLNNGLPILHKVPPKRDYGRYFCIMAEKGGTSHGGLTEKLSLFFHAKKQEVNAYGR